MEIMKINGSLNYIIINLYFTSLAIYIILPLKENRSHKFFPKQFVRTSIHN
jgi:hypothetical protein